MENNLKPKGLCLTIVFEAESANYGESIGNISALKKLSRGKGDQYTYISRQAIRYNIVDQLGEDLANVIATSNKDKKDDEMDTDEDEINVIASGRKDKKVIQFSEDATIDKYPEIDFFGYLKTMKGTSGKKRSAKVRLTNAISLEPFRGDLDYLTNKGLADRINSNMNIAQSEIHRSFYRYTIVADLDQIGIDEVDNIFIDNKEKARRVKKLLTTVEFLYRDIRGRREDLKPLFVIGGVYDIKNPIFANTVTVRNLEIPTGPILSVMNDRIKKDTYCGIVKDIFKNENQIVNELGATTTAEFFNIVRSKVDEYYEGC